MSDPATPERRDEPAPVVTVTEPARAKVKGIRDNEPDGDRLALWLEVTGAAGPEYAYDMYFEVPDAAGPDDVVQRHDDLTLVIPAASVDRLRGATLGMSRDLLNPGMALTNPNKPPAPPSPSPTVPLTAKPGDLTGDIPDRVRQVLDTQINPSIASHGGRAELVGVDGGTAYLRLGGGCQGCGMAQVTLSQGIEVAIKELVPEITDVRDVTDHASGSNPYYESSKK